MKLPYGKDVRVEELAHKIETYSLNFNHNKGKHKARIFRAKLGITLQNKAVLIEALLAAAVSAEATAKNSDMHGEQYTVDFPLLTDSGSELVRSRWIIRVDEQHPRLVSVYPI